MNAAAVNSWVVHTKHPRWHAGLITWEAQDKARVFFPAVDEEGKPFERCFARFVLQPATEADIKLALTEGQTRWQRFEAEAARKNGGRTPAWIRILLAGLMNPR